MIVYHGSYTKIKKVDLSKCEPNKDFGRGFYVTKIKEQAEVWAEIKGDKNKTKGVVTEFDFYEAAFTNGLYKVLRFGDYSDEWLDFVVQNRRFDLPQPTHDYDIVEGPIADDRISKNIMRYIDRVISREEFFKMLRHDIAPSHQICFCTADSLLMLRFRNGNFVTYKVSEMSDILLEHFVIDFNIGEEKATDLFYSSDTFEKLADESTELYKKPWQEVYKLLKQELRTKTTENAG
jgi:hypothetical protein